MRDINETSGSDCSQAARKTTPYNDYSTVNLGSTQAAEHNRSLVVHYGALTPQDCPWYDKCSAPLCPLDPEWRGRKHLQGERVCYFLREAVKDGARARFEATANAPIFAAASQMLSEQENLGAYVRQRLRDAAQAESRLDAAKRLAALTRGRP